MATTVKRSVHNITKGIRGLNGLTGYVELEAGETRPDVEMTEAEFENAKRTGYFEFDGSGSGTSDQAKAAEAAADELPGTHKLLDKLAADEVPPIVFGAEVKTVADKQAAITAARTARAAPAATGGGAQGDELDRMSDDDLRNTAAAIAGKPVTELADMDRDALLALARTPPAS